MTILEQKTCDAIIEMARNGVVIKASPDYWTRLEHQYAGMAMQGVLSNEIYTKHLLENSTSAKDARDSIVGASRYIAHALVEKMKEGRKR